MWTAGRAGTHVLHARSQHFYHQDSRGHATTPPTFQSLATSGHFMSRRPCPTQGHFISTPEDFCRLPLLLPPHVARSTRSHFTWLLPGEGACPLGPSLCSSLSGFVKFYEYMWPQIHDTASKLTFANTKASILISVCLSVGPKAPQSDYPDPSLPPRLGTPTTVACQANLP